ncbi:hypothetical protein CCR75_004184 [Bremia lactucae]|uniref:VPS9 domain-containing protein n=1 Tax=Bremia lactucae TaxID=4779 RepID=A0A976FJI6_BRELC|nr:hypothetical protein CCR75_004184 [Bremia lactucae]
MDPNVADAHIKPRKSIRKSLSSLTRIDDGTDRRRMDPDVAITPETAGRFPPGVGAASAASSSSGTGSNILPPMPPLVFSPTKGNAQQFARSMTLEQYTKWPYLGLRPGLSVRLVRCETMSSVTDYIVHVIDLHTRVFWITKKRFSDFYDLRRKVRGIIRCAVAAEEEKEYLRFLLELPFPRRRFRPTNTAAVTRGMGEIEVFLRNLAALEPDSMLQRSLLTEFQFELCSVEFVSSLEKIDTTGEPIEPKWLTYDLFRRLNCDGAVEGSTCYQFLHAFRNRVVTIENAVCPGGNESEGIALAAAAAVKDLRNTITSIEKYILEHLDPQYVDTLSLLDQSVNVTSVVEDCVFHAVEDTISVPLENQVTFLVGTTVNKEAEKRLARNIERLKCRSQIESGIPEHLQSDEDWGLSCHHLSMIDERTLPMDKIQELLRAALEIFKSCGEKNLDWHENSALTADDYLPIHIYVVVKSGLKRPLATKELLGAMIHPSLMLGEVGYFLTMFEVALQYIADM